MLDRNGYAPSILDGHDKYHCWLCDKNGSGKLDRHEIYHGPFREKSKALGLWVHLCHSECHLNGVHKYSELDLGDTVSTIAQSTGLSETTVRRRVRGM